MKTIIECSFYAYMIALIVTLSLSFVILNNDITQKNQELRSIETYLEIESETINVNAATIKTGTVSGDYYVYHNVRYPKKKIDTVSSTTIFSTLTADSAQKLINAAKNMGIELTLNFMDETKSYGYIEYEAKYPIIFGFFNLKRNISTTGYGRYGIGK